MKGSIIPQPLWAHSSTELSNPRQLRSDNQTISAPSFSAVHSLWTKLCLAGGPWPSCRQITSAVWNVKELLRAQIVPHVPLYLICTRPELGMSIPNNLTSTSERQYDSLDDESRNTKQTALNRLLPCLPFLRQLTSHESSKQTKSKPR